MSFLSRSKAKSGRWYRTRRMIAQVNVYFFLLIVCIMSLYPTGMMFINSLKSDNEMYVNPAGLPIRWTLASYEKIFQYHGGLWRNFIVSATVSGSSTIIALFLCALAAFGFAKYRFKGRDLIFSLLLATMMVPSEVTIPGQFIIFAKLHWLNTVRVQIVPRITPVLGLFLIRQYMMDIPDALIEAARLDGAGHFTTFWRIMVPTSAPVLGAYGILCFMSSWNAYTWPAIVATSSDVQPIMVVLPQLVDPIIGLLPVWGTVMAGCVLSTIPILIVFVALQDVFMSSMVIGALKG